MHLQSFKDVAYDFTFDSSVLINFVLTSSGTLLKMEEYFPNISSCLKTLISASGKRISF